MKKLNNENAYAILEAGKTYKFAGYVWTACELVNDGRTAVIQSHGVTHGAWPGFVMQKFGNGNYYADSIDGEDISAYDDKLKELYNAIKDVEDKSASYGKGLYLISKEKVEFTKWGYPGSGYYWTELKAVAENACQFGFANNATWLGTIDGGAYAWYVNMYGFIYYSNDQNNDFVVAPAFNLDLTKVEIKGDEIIKKSKFDFASMAMTVSAQSDSSKELTDSMTVAAQSDSSKELTDSSQYHSVLEYGMNLTRDGETFHLDPEMVNQIFEAIKEDNGRNYVATFTNRKFSREQYIAICDEVENLLTNDSGDVKYHACEHVLGVGFDNYTGQQTSDNLPKKMDL